MGTFWHVLRRGKVIKLPQRIIFFDCETFPKPYQKRIESHHLKVGKAVYVSRHKTRLKWVERWHTFETVNSFWNFVESHVEKKKRLWLIAHNQQFDFMVVDGFNQLVKRGWELKWHIITSNLFIVRFMKSSSSFLIVDSINWFRSSLKTMGKVIGKPKFDIDFETCSMQELTDYCHRDVEIVKDSVLSLIKFVRENNFGSFQFTCAGQSFTAYKHRFMPYKIFIHAHPGAIALERASYRGGRNECFFIGKITGRVYDIDVNSLFPFVMWKYDYPCKLYKVVSDVSVDRLLALIRNFHLVATLKINIKHPFIGLKAQRLMFPVGTFWATLTTPEIKAVAIMGEILDVKDVALYRKAPLFRKWVDEVYAMRLDFAKTGNLVFEDFTKISLNSLYGKFGQKSGEFKQIGTAAPDIVKVERGIDYETNQTFIEYTYGGKVYLRSAKDKEGRDSFPAIASHVTAYARMYLYSLMLIAGLDNIYYCDTDSLFLNQVGFNNLSHLIDESKLGYLKVEKVSDKVIIKGCKDYQIDDLIKIKGIKKNAVQISDNVYEQTRFYKFRSLLRKDSLNAPLTEVFTKELKRVYLKGIVGKDGFVKPFSLPSPCFDF